MINFDKIIINLKRLLFLAVFVGMTSFAFSQPYNNSWISNYAQQYYKFKVAETGIYRIDSTVLADALATTGTSLSTVNPQNIQLFARGVEIPIYIEGEGDGVFDGADFIEFYGQKNDGWLDERLYGSAIDHPSPYYSLYNDTISYFLTWNTSTTNNRLVLETDINFSSYTPITSFFKENIDVYSAGSKILLDPYYDGKTQSVGGSAVTMFGFAATEGWFDNPYTLGGNRVKNIASANADLLGPNATLEAVVISWSDYIPGPLDPPLLSPPFNHHLNVSLGSNVFDTIFQGFEKIDVQMSIPVADLGAVTTAVNFASINDLAAGADKQTVSYMKLKYPHTMDLEGASVFDHVLIDDHPTESKTLFNFSNFSSTGNVLFYDLTNDKRIQVMPNGANFQCLVPNSGLQKECYVSDDGLVKNVSSLTAINGTGLFIDHGANPVDTAFIIVTHPSLMTGAIDYRNYRLAGNINADPQNAVIYDIEDLYDQFAYGIEKHPLATRGFVEYILNAWPSQPNYLFLLGKSIKSKENRRSTVNYNGNLVPSFGVPASDNMITAGLNGTFYEPAIPTGRLAAKNNTEIAWYLNKVQEHENPQPAPNGSGVSDWTKRVLHFGGGTTASEQLSFKSFLNNYETIIEDTSFGGNVTSYYKNSTAPVQVPTSDSIKDFIGQGVALMTFLGHASTTGGFDQNIDDPNLWPDPQGRYPLLIGLACFAGDIHIPSAISTSEEHVLLDNKGVIGFLSSVDLSLSSTLNAYASQFYKNMSYTNYGESIGRHIKGAILQTQQPSVGVENFSNSTALNVTLHGDPSVVLNTFEFPDYMIESSTITFNPTVVTSDIDSFDINVLVTNLGKAVNDTIVLEVVRDYPDQVFVDTVYTATFPGTNYQETISFRMPVDVVRGLGLNTFTITVDAINTVVESFENNNTVTTTLNILSGEIIPIYPYEYMIVPDSTDITLKASTAFPFEPAKDYIFEIDTTDYFNSPVLETTMVNQTGGVVSWTPNLPLTLPDSTVYFWRVSKDSVDATGYSWRLRSFQYIKGKEGWEQDHFFQFENDGYQFVTHNRPIRQFNFVNDIKQLKVNNQGKADWVELNLVNYMLDSDIKGRNAYGTPTAIHVAVLDSVTLEPWSADDRNSGQTNVPGANSSSYENYFVFRHNATQMAALESFIKDTVPSGNHIVMWSCYIVNLVSFTDSMPPSLRNYLGTNMGATQLPTIPNLYPFIFYHQKGNLGSTIEVIGDSIPHKNLNLTTSLSTSANYANIYSEILGPAVSWDSLSWRMTPLESPSTKDSTVLSVIGVDASGNETPLPTLANLPTDSGDISITGRIDAAVYPYLKLNAYLSDDSLLTAPQLDRWQVTYTGVPEAALDPNINFTFQNDTVEEGVDITMTIAVKNISRYDMDSLLISFVVLDKNNNLQFLPYPRQKPLLSDSVLIASITFSTFGMGGINSLLIDVNPNNDQLEKYHFNNVAQIPFYVNSDNINPILDVTFDGIHILDGDIVSPKANIVMELTDENQFLLLNDTSDYAVYITNPNGVEKRIYFNSGGVENMQFIPASLPKNNSKIIMQGDFPVDGKYKLRVQASDRTKNNSGNFDYIIGFEVINRSTITNILNYPNPFTTSTRFVFTLTGSEVPDIFKIQIMTITGKVVREIHKNELGAINIGRNITDFAWDGTDTYGDRLANGLYLYRVITKINSDDIEHRETSADGYFKKGFGKMYLFR